MSEPFAPMVSTVLWFRVARPAFLPQDAVLPNPDWLIPTTDDIAEGEARGRRPGLSIWDRALTTIEQACLIMDEPDRPAFGMTVDEVRRLGAASNVDLEAVYDAVEGEPPPAGGDGHGLLEGLKRPDGLPGGKKRFKALRNAIAERLRPID